MNRSLIIILLALIASYATAQTNVSKTTDRLEAATTLNYRDGAEYIKFMPTVSDLLSQYRKLLLPDVIIDEWTDAKSR